jgi:hypothetical protein
MSAYQHGFLKSVSLVEIYNSGSSCIESGAIRSSVIYLLAITTRHNKRVYLPSLAIKAKKTNSTR